MATTAQFSVDANTINLYHMDGTVGSAGKMADSSGNGNNLTEVSSPTAGTGQILPTANGAYLSSSTSTRLQFASTIGAGAWTMEGWYNSTNTTDGNVIYSSYNATNYSQLACSNTGTPVVYAEIAFTTGTIGVKTSGGVFDGAWHYIAVTYDQSGTNSVKIYIDGVAQTLTNVIGTNNATGTITSNHTWEFFGNVVSGSAGTPALDEWRISNIARSATAISNYYVGGTTYTQTYTEAITVTDTLLKSTTRVLTDAISVTDTFLATILRLFTESITNTDTFLGNRVKPYSFTETITATDAFLRSITSVLSEAVTVTDSLLKSTVRLFTESINVTDTFTQMVTFLVSLTESIIAKDSIRILRNGTDVIWTHISRASAATWTKVSRATASVWTKITRN